MLFRIVLCIIRIFTSNSNKRSVVMIAAVILSLVLPLHSSIAGGQFFKADSMCTPILKVYTSTPLVTMVFVSRSGKRLYLQWGTDTLKCTGDLEVDSAAAMFIDKVSAHYLSTLKVLNTKIDSLNCKINRLQNRDGGL